jgi:hypothetical protein
VATGERAMQADAKDDAAVTPSPHIDYWQSFKSATIPAQM